MKSLAIVLSVIFIIATIAMASYMLLSFGSEDDVDDQSFAEKSRKHSTPVVKPVIVRQSNDSRINDIMLRLEALENVSSGDETEDVEHNGEQEDVTAETFAAMEAERIKRERYVTEKKYQTYEEKLNSESVDAEWDWTMKENLGAVLQDSVLSSVNEYKFNCGSEMCKLETTHQNGQYQNDFLSKVIPSIFKEASNDIDGIWQMQDLDEEGESLTRIYFFKKGAMRKIEDSV